jgi:20S proteasome alpha/beta subunit
VGVDVPALLHQLTDDSNFTGLTADGRVLIDKARIECQSHRLTVEDPVTIEYITRHIAGIQQVIVVFRSSFFGGPYSVQRYTQSGGVRPFGIATLIVGFDPNDTRPRLYMTEPSGIYSAWKVCVTSAVPTGFADQLYIRPTPLVVRPRLYESSWRKTTKMI